MNSDKPTGGMVPFEEQSTARADFDLEKEQVSGDRWAPGFETVGSRSTGETKRRSVTVPASTPQLPSRHVPARSLRKRRLYLKACLDELERLRDSGDDPIHKDNAFVEMKNQLQVLWELVDGNPDSEAFEEMVNVIQIAFCGETAESLKPCQLGALSAVLAKLHEEPDLDDQSANDLTTELIRGGFDVFREIG